SFNGGSLQDIMSELVLMTSVGSIVKDPSDGQPKAVGGIVPTTSNFIAGMYATPPASAQSYVAYVLNSANIAQPAYAQGLGFSALSPILSAWIIFRNIAYFFFVAIFVIIGFMIMFR